MGSPPPSPPILNPPTFQIVCYVLNLVMKTFKHSSYNQSQAMAKPTKVDHQDTEHPVEEAEEIKRRIYVGGMLLFRHYTYLLLLS